MSFYLSARAAPARRMSASSMTLFSLSNEPTNTARNQKSFGRSLTRSIHTARGLNCSRAKQLKDGRYMETKYNDYYNNQLESGKRYQDFVVDVCWNVLGLAIVQYCSKTYQQCVGES